MYNILIMCIIFLLDIASCWLLLLMPFPASDVDRPIFASSGDQLIGRSLGDLKDHDLHENSYGDDIARGERHWPSGTSESRRSMAPRCIGDDPPPGKSNPSGRPPSIIGHCS